MTDKEIEKLCTQYEFEEITCDQLVEKLSTKENLKKANEYFRNLHGGARPQ